MIDLEKIDYSSLDRMEIVRYLFYPRPEFSVPWNQTSLDLMIPVEKGVSVGARFHVKDKAGPNIIFFHGNGEIVADYDDIAEIYTHLGINFFPVDYRGYGRSTGTPSVTAMMRDAHVSYTFVRNWLDENGHTGSFIVMGRSLGSAPALELLASYGDKIDASIIESGFAHTSTLLRILGIDMRTLGLTEEDGFRNIDKIRTFGKPTLIIHAEHDHILPFKDGRALYEASPAPEKILLMIQGANHNDILLRGLDQYVDAVKELTRKAAALKQ
ncbi:MAG: alpha/beta hydrolase [Syntrophales bacterium]